MPTKADVTRNLKAVNDMLTILRPLSTADRAKVIDACEVLLAPETKVRSNTEKAAA